MKDIEYCMNLLYEMLITEDKEEGGYVASFPDLVRCLTCVDTLEKLVCNAEDAKKEWISTALCMGLSILEPTFKNKDYSE